jgi:membrane fusion protein (multidrug efflux system)
MSPPPSCRAAAARALRPALGALVLALACGSEAPPPPAPPEVPVAPVIQRHQPIVIEMVGETQGSADIPIRARVEGVLLGMHFTEGRRVQQGDLLYGIDPAPFESKVVEAEGNLAEARTRLAKARADLARIRPLAEMNAVSQQDLDGAVAQYEAAKGAVQASEARVEQARIELGYTKLHAPIDGRIGITQAKVGEFVGRSPNPVVLNFVSRTDPIRVRFSIDERRYLQLARRLRADEGTPREDAERPANLELVLTDGTVHPHKGRLVATGAAVDPQTGTFTLEADFPNPEEIVLAGQFARVRAVAETIPDALLVPQRAVSELQGNFRVHVIGPDGTVELRPVELGPTVGELRIVRSGLEAGEQVALDTMRLRPGTKAVAVREGGASGDAPAPEVAAEADGA